MDSIWAGLFGPGVGLRVEGCVRRGSEPGTGLSKAVRAALCHQSLFLLPMCLNRSELLELSQYALLSCFWDFVILAYRLQNGGHSLGLFVVIFLISCELPDLTPSWLTLKPHAQ